MTSHLTKLRALPMALSARSTSFYQPLLDQLRPNERAILAQRVSGRLKDHGHRMPTGRGNASAA